MLASALGSITDRILSFPAAVVLALVFALPALEASAFVGFIFPGETVVILGGVVASQGKVPLWAVFVAAASGAIIGDSVGYFIGQRWGAQLLHGTVGRLPIIRRHLDSHAHGDGRRRGDEHGRGQGLGDAGPAAMALPRRIAGSLLPTTPGRTILPLADLELLRRVLDGLQQM